MIVVSIKSVVFLRSSVFWDKCGIHFEWLSLILLNPVLTLHCLLPCLSVGHPKHIISLHSPIYTTVSWNRLPQSLCLGLIIYTIEYICCIILWLLLGRSLPRLRVIYPVEGPSVSVISLVLLYIIWFLRLTTKELMDCVWWNRLLYKKSWTVRILIY